MFDIKQLLASPGINRLLQPLHGRRAGHPAVEHACRSGADAGSGSADASTGTGCADAAAAGSPALWTATTPSRKATGDARSMTSSSAAMGESEPEPCRGWVQMVATGRAERGKKNQNQTVEWLTKQGMSPEEAQMVASQPNVLSEFLKQRMKGGQESEYQQRAAAAQQYGLDPNTPGSSITS